MKACTLIASLYSAALSAEELGRLFTTPGERAALEGSPSHAQNAGRSRSVQVQGVVLRRGGEPLAWIDDRPVARGENVDGFVLLDAGPAGALVLRKLPPRIREGEADGKAE